MQNFIYVFLLFLNSQNSVFAEVKPTSHEGLSARLAALVTNSKIPKGELGIFATFSTGTTMPPLLAIQEDHPLNPASITKIWVAGTLLDQLKAGFCLITEMQTTAHEITGPIKGDIFIRGLSDPSMSTVSIWTLIQKLKIKGVTEIQGDLILNDGRSKDPATPAFSLNENVFVIKLFADSKNQQPRLSLDLETEYLTVENKVVVTEGKKPTAIKVQQVSMENNSKEKVILSGSLNRNDFRNEVEIQVLHPTFFFGHAIQELLKEAGIPWKGVIRRGSKPNGIIRTISFYKSPPIEDLITTMNKESRNFYADILTTHLSPGEPKSIEKGKKEILDFQSRFGNKGSMLFLESPSGLSRKNRISARTTVEFLEAQLQTSTVAEFASSLAINGMDGTLRDRLKDPVLSGRIRAKTGQLFDVTSIAGYLWTKTHGFIPFAFIYNGTKHKAQASQLFDQLLGEIAQSIK